MDENQENQENQENLENQEERQENHEISVKQELLNLLRQTDATRQMAEALVREATGGGRSTSVIKALEEVREIIGAAFDDTSGEKTQIPWNQLSDEELLNMIGPDGERFEFYPA